MLGIAAQTLRGRWGLSVGSFVALAFGVTVGGSAGLLIATPGLTEEGAALLGVLGSVSFFVAIFVVAGTYAFSVEQRGRELALMRAIGATPRQVRRLIVGETLLIGALASLVGCVLAVPVSMLLRLQLAAVGFQLPGVPVGRSLLALAVAFLAGLVVARLAVGPASRRASRARPAEALREATIEGRVMTRGRWITGVLFLGCAVAILAAIPWLPLTGLFSLATGIAEILVIALAALTPLFVAPLARMAGKPLVRITRASGALALAGIHTGVRRVSSTAAPVLVTVAIFGSLAGVVASIVVSNERDNRHSLLASVIVDSVEGQPLPESAMAAVAELDGVRAVVPVRLAEFAVVRHDSDGEYAQGPYAVMAIDQEDLAEVTRIRVQAGDPLGLGAHAVAVNSLVASEFGARPGDTLAIRSPDGTDSEIRIAAIVDLPPAFPADFLTAAPDAAGWPVSRLLVATDEGTDAGALAGRIQAVVGVSGRATTTEDWIVEDTRKANRSSWLAVLLLLGASTVFAVISIGNAQLMAAGQRAEDVARLRRIGATPAQTVRMVVWETCACVGVGATLGAATAIVSTGLVWWAMRQFNPWAVMRVPWLVFVGVVMVCLLIAVGTATGSVLRTARANRSELAA